MNNIISQNSASFVNLYRLRIIGMNLKKQKILNNRRVQFQIGHLDILYLLIGKRFKLTIYTNCISLAPLPSVFSKNNLF